MSAIRPSGEATPIKVRRFNESGSSRKEQSSGQALIELAILAPWIFFLFIAVVDTGFCVVAAITVQNAARAGALYTSSRSSSLSGSCAVVTQELQSLTNYSGISGGACSSPPLQVSFVQLASGIDGNPAAEVTVTYQTIPLIPVPLLFTGPVTLVSTVEMAMRP